MAVEIERLKTITYFQELNKAELEGIKSYISEKTAEKGEVILIEGDWSDYMYFIISGLVKVYKASAEGQEQILQFARPGEALNDVSTFDGGPNAAGMVAVTPATLYMVRKTDLLNTILKEYPKICYSVIKALAHKVRRDSVLAAELSFHHVISRLARMLLKFQAGEQGEEELRLTQQDMAGAVGTTREVVNRSLRVLEERGVIRLVRHRIQIIDREALEDLAKTPAEPVARTEQEVKK